MIIIIMTLYDNLYHEACDLRCALVPAGGCETLRLPSMAVQLSTASIDQSPAALPISGVCPTTGVMVGADTRRPSPEKLFFSVFRS